MLVHLIPHNSASSYPILPHLMSCLLRTAQEFQLPNADPTAFSLLLCCVNRQLSTQNKGKDGFEGDRVKIWSGFRLRLGFGVCRGIRNKARPQPGSEIKGTWCLLIIDSRSGPGSYSESESHSGLTPEPASSPPTLQPLQLENPNPNIYSVSIIGSH